jgi:hypothetical protein
VWEVLILSTWTGTAVLASTLIWILDRRASHLLHTKSYALPDSLFNLFLSDILALQGTTITSSKLTRLC